LKLPCGSRFYSIDYYFFAIHHAYHNYASRVSFFSEPCRLTCQRLWIASMRFL